MNAYELADISRRKALGLAGVFLVAAACSPEKLFGPCAVSPSEPPPDQGSEPGRSDESITSRDATTALQFDGLMRELVPTPNLAIHYDGWFKTAGVYRWGQYASRNLGDNWTVDGDGEIAIDPSAIADVDSQPLFCLAGPAKRASGITTRGNHSALARVTHGSLRTGGVLLEGDGQIDRVTFKDFGSRVDESFVGVVDQGAGSASITNCVFDEFDPSSSDTQLSVFLIDGVRSYAHMEGNVISASGAGNWVQGHTIYRAQRGLVRGNRTLGARMGYYGDYWATRGITIEENDFLDCEHGVQLKLSPTPLPYADSFSHEDYTIGWNRIRSSGKNVSLDTCGPPTSTRFIRGIRVHPSLSLEHFGAEFTREGCGMAA